MMRSIAEGGTGERYRSNPKLLIRVRGRAGESAWAHLGIIYNRVTSGDMPGRRGARF